MRFRRKSSPDDAAAEAAAGIDGPADGAHGADAIPDVRVLDELAEVFGEDPPSARSDRPTITIGGDDDVVDIVYLDDELGRDHSGSGPVFIDDDGSSDAVLPQQATVRGMEPRLRQRRIGVRRAASRKRLWWAAITVVVLAVVIGALAVLGSSWFAVEDIAISGVVYTDREQLDAIVEDLRGTPVLLVDSDEFEERIEAIPWVEEARVGTRFPDSATIEVRERVPVASMLGEDLRSRVLDADGRVLAVIDGQPVALVWISGVGTLDLDVGETAPVGVGAAASLVTKLTPTVRPLVESVTVTPDGGDLILTLTGAAGPIEVRFGSALGDSEQIEKLVRLERALADIGPDTVSVIDVSTDEVTVR